MVRYKTIKLAMIIGLWFLTTVAAGFSTPLAPQPLSEVTILCYMNGDNDLAQEVLHALDMMETVGSSPSVNVIALVDGHPQWLAPYDAAWSQARLVHLQADPEIGRITSPVLEEWGEADLGAPETLERFVHMAIDRFPARRYLFYTFAHGQGVIDTRCYQAPAPAKTVSMSRDDTSGRKLTMEQFHRALKQGLDRRRFEMMVLFSCLANMVEVSYTLSDVTHFVVSSQDEIRLVNQPPGRYQIRGLRFEDLIARLQARPRTDVRSLGRALVDSHVNSYAKTVLLPGITPSPKACRFAGDMALLNAEAMPQLVEALDELARQLIRHADSPRVVAAMQAALSATQPFASFLNLEYYDLQGFVQHLRAGIRQPDLQAACDRVLNILAEHILVYARSTPDCSATGVSIYLSHPLVPENIYQTHQMLYRANAFSRDTHWDEMIQIYRPRLRAIGGTGLASSSSQKNRQTPEREPASK
ncbi:MAG: clostripain-related cysteine peptidase [Desulfobacterales bacterium]|jgi:hypothetical protein